MTNLDEYRLKNTTLEVAAKNLLAEVELVKNLPQHYLVHEVERNAYMAGLIKSYEIMVDAKGEMLTSAEKGNHD